MKTVDSKTVQCTFDRCTWGTTRETAADWLTLLSGADKAACHLERRRKVWRFLYLGERLPIPELDWTIG